MIKALHTAASGMVAQSIKQDIIANNIANAQTPGFKRERVVASSFQQTLQQAQALVQVSTGIDPYFSASMVQSSQIHIEAANDNSEGPIETSGSDLNFAIDGEGTFEVMAADMPRYTRNGSFMVDTDGELATINGEKVQGSSGAIKVPDGKWSVSPTGAIISNGSEVDQIKINGAGSSTRVVQGSLEGSNVSIIREMVDMISNIRSYEANQKVVASVDSTLDKIINEVGKV
ncbi:MAG: flagellar hook-basal body protein [Armatimonadota bacterium]|jgi:flagellar basal-body rod protein FlgF